MATLPKVNVFFINSTAVDTFANVKCRLQSESRLLDMTKKAPAKEKMHVHSEVPRSLDFLVRRNETIFLTSLVAKFFFSFCRIFVTCKKHFFAALLSTSVRDGPKRGLTGQAQVQGVSGQAAGPLH